MTFMPLMKSWWKDPIFTGAVIIAVALHIMLLALQFGMPQEQDAMSKEIAVTLRQADKEPEHADFLAQTNQQGSGEFREAHRMSSDMPAPMLEQKAGESQQESLDMLEQKQQLSFEEKILMTTLSWQKQAEDAKRKKNSRTAQ